MKRVLLVLMASTIGQGCTPSTEKKAWTEEVDLGDGSSVMVKRSVEFQTSNSLSGDAFGMTDLKSTLSIENQASVPLWKSVFMPIVLYQDRANSQWTIVATTFSCDIWRDKGRPQPPYWEFRLVNGSWTAVSISTTSFSRRTNLFFRYMEPIPDSPIKVALKDRILDRSRVTEQFKKIASDAKPGC